MQRLRLLTQRSAMTTAAASVRPMAAAPASTTTFLTTSTRPSIDADLQKHQDSFHHFVMKKIRQHPANKTAFKCAVSGEILKYGDIEPLVLKYAAVLHHRYGLCAGNRVLLMCPNTPKYIALFHAILALGCVVSPVNSLATVDEVRRQAVISGAKLAIAHPVYKPLLGESVEKLGGGKAPVMYSDVDLAGVDALPDSARVPVNCKDTANAPAVIPFSSGTTGMPKGVMLTHRNLVANVLQTQVATEMNHNDVMLSVLPYFHIYGLTVMLHNVLGVGGTQITFPKFDMDSYLDAMNKERATLAYVAPPLMVGFIKHPKTKQIDTSGIRQVLSGAAPLGEEVQRMCEPLFPHADIGQGYGLTETSPVLTVGLENGIYGTAGTLVSGTEARIVGERYTAGGAGEPSFVDLAGGEEGELWVRGPQIMRGYLNAEDTEVVMPHSEGGDWFRTGDLGHFDQSQNLVITDRLKELIKYKGMQVAPAELEAVLQQHDDVMEALVVGVPTDDGSGEVPRAHVVLKKGIAAAPAVEAALQEFIKSKVAPSKLLRGGVKFVENIPKTASGKLLRRIVRDEERKTAAAAPKN